VAAALVEFRITVPYAMRLLIFVKKTIVKLLFGCFEELTVPVSAVLTGVGATPAVFCSIVKISRATTVMRRMPMIMWLRSIFVYWPPASL
jgi:hypothetical protein